MKGYLNVKLEIFNKKEGLKIYDDERSKFQ